MRLYHFTSRARAAQIEREGIIFGDVPTGPMTGFNAPWLTSEPRFERQGWARGSALWKTEIRFTVEIPDDHPNLYSWAQVRVAANVSDDWARALATVQGRSMDTDYVYLGGVPPEWIVEVTSAGADGNE